jgi:protein CWC15
MAHMPTYYPTKGRENDTGTKIISRRDQAAHKKLKYRSMGQASSAELGDREAILSKLQAKEEKELSKKEKAIVKVIQEEKSVNTGGNNNLLLTDGSVATIAGKYDDADDEDKGNGDDDGFDSSSEEESDDDEDDEAELQAELERIRAERAAEKKKKEEEAAQEQAINANPLMNGGEDGSARVKRRWNDDVVFKNQAKEEPAKKGRFINDPLRSDFHRAFMRKYLK